MIKEQRSPRRPKKIKRPKKDKKKKKKRSHSEDDFLKRSESIRSSKRSIASFRSKSAERPTQEEIEKIERELDISGTPASPKPMPSPSSRFRVVGDVRAMESPKQNMSSSQNNQYQI